MANDTSRLIIFQIALSLSGFSLPSYALAQVTTGNLNVQIRITDECTLGTISGIDFGTTGLIGANIDGQGSVEVTCTNGTDYSLTLDEGSGTGATEASRLMTLVSGTETVSYSLWQDSLRTDPWGTGSDALSGVGTGDTETLDVFGRVPPQSTPPAGVYDDTVTVTISY